MLIYQRCLWCLHTHRPIMTYSNFCHQNHCFVAKTCHIFTIYQKMIKRRDLQNTKHTNALPNIYIQKHPSITPNKNVEMFQDFFLCPLSRLGLSDSFWFPATTFSFLSKPVRAPYIRSFKRQLFVTGTYSWSAASNAKSQVLMAPQISWALLKHG